jgi:hypothetical protein
MFNAMAMFQRNDTLAFMNKNFEEEDHKFVMQTARELDESGIEKKRQLKVVEYNIQKVKEKNAKRGKAAQKKAEKKSRLAKVTLIFDKDQIQALKGMSLQEHVDAFYLVGAPLPKLKKDVKTVASKKSALQEAIDKYNAGEWVPKSLDIESSDSSPADEENGDDDDDGEE